MTTRIIGGYRAKRTRLLKDLENATGAVRRDIQREIRAYTRLICALQAL